MPAIGPDRVVRLADMHPDWLIRTEAIAVLRAARELVPETA
jgi:hypothetical protein